MENLPSPAIFDYVVLGTDVQNGGLNMVNAPYGDVIALML
jgi:hypothetical protein